MATSVIPYRLSDYSPAISNLKGDIAIVQDGDTATRTIAIGSYVVWKGNLYTAKQAIGSGTTLSTTNLQAVSDGGLNALNGKIASQTNLGSNVKINDTSIASGSFETVASFNVQTPGNYLVIVDMSFPSGNGIRILLVDTYETSQNSSLNSVLVEGRACLQKVRAFNLTTSDTIYIRVYQNTGSAGSVGGYYKLIKLSD